MFSTLELHSRFSGKTTCNLCRIIFVRAVSRQDFTSEKLSVDAFSQLSEISWQVGWRNQLMVSRLADLSQENEASQISPPPWSAWLVKPDVLGPGMVGMRGSIVIRLRPCIN